MKQFNNTAILTSKNPEVFLNFTYDASDYWIIPKGSIGSEILYVNGLDINVYDTSLGYALLLDSSNNMASFHVYANSNEPFDTNLTFRFYDTENLISEVSTHDVSIHNRPYIISSGSINSYSNDDLLVDDEASYMLIRTNPKFTGNICLYVDCSYNLFLDTFKISDILSNKTYRKQRVSANSILSSDIRNVFSSMPLGELYKVDVDNILSIGIPKTEYKDQYNTTYNYGARLLKDELYKEDYGLLAPLWINSKLPDYFAVFKLDGVFNPETYTGASLSNLAFKYLEESNIIKTWSLKEDSPLGKYLQTHLNDVIKIQAPVFLSLSDYDPNTWYGIAVDKGVFTGRSETPYFFNQKTNNFTDLNAFVSQGFERNTLLCPNLLNLEFVFDDNDESLYTMSRYFGLYLTENVLYEIGYYSNTINGDVEIISLDGKDSSVFMNSAVFDSSGNISSEYANRIFVLNDGTELHRITNVNQINDSSFNSYVSKPYKNIFSVQVEKTNINPFITLTLNRVLEQGEHLRIINKTQRIIWEAYSVDASQFSCDVYCSVTEDPSAIYPTVFRTYFDMNGSISSQVRQIELAFDRFADYPETVFRSGVRGSNWVSIILNDNANFNDEWMFQRITSSTLDDFNDPSSNFNNAAFADDITFFGRFTPNSSDFEVIQYDAAYGPIDFELYGNRQSIMLSLFNRQDNNLYSFDSSQNVLDKIEEPTLYQGTDSWYRKILDFDVSNNSYLYVKDPLHINDKVLIMAEADIRTIQGYLNAYSIHPLNISLMGINPVRDIDYTVYDSSNMNFTSEYWYKREDDISTYYISVESGAEYIVDIQGSYAVESGTGTLTQNSSIRNYDVSTLFNTFDSSILVTATTDTMITYAVLNGTHEYKSYSSSQSEETIWDYYDSSAFLKYGLTVPVVSKWVGLGNDIRNNSLRLLLNADILDVSTNFIADSNNFSQEISYPVFKYLSSGSRAWESYIFYDINDVIYDGSTYLTFKEAMFEYPYVDYFSKLVYSNNNVDAKKVRSSIVYYNGYKNAIDTTITGLNLSIKVQNIVKALIDIKNYDRYRFSFISTSSKNRSTRHPIEVIVNENTKTILMIWYQGNDELHYNKRYSTYLPGKSLLDPSEYGFVSGVDMSTYSFVKTPYYVNNSTLSKTIRNLYDRQSTYDSSTARPYAQFNKSSRRFNSIFNSPGENSIIGQTLISTNSYNTFAQYINYTYLQNSNTYGDYIANYGYRYNSNENMYINNTTNIDTLRYLLSPSYDNVMYYIIRENSVYSNYELKTKPLIISINPPKTFGNIQTYYGWFKPKFNSIFEFNSNENSELIEIVDRDFIFSNTNLRLSNNIPQLWYNKVVSNVTTLDVSSGGAIGYVRDFNVFKSLWDNRYYLLGNTYIPGYNSPDELPSFFGSKLIKLPDELVLDTWDTTTVSGLKTSTEIILTYNLSRAVLNKFKSIGNFNKNWSGLSGTDDVKDLYIKNTILTYYNLSISKIKVDFYYRSLQGFQRYYYKYNPALIHDNKQNFNGQLLYENNDYFYKIIIPSTANLTYYVKFTIIEK